MSVKQFAVQTEGLRHHYREREALCGVDLRVERGEIFGMLGPNGGGKTTLFRVLTTDLPVQEGKATVLGFDVSAEYMEVRGLIGVVFQSPSLDKKLTVRESLFHHGRLYGLDSREILRRSEEMLRRMEIADRADDLVETLSGGLSRRAELAKGLLHQPELLILDEPCAGLDPTGRRDLWQHLEDLQKEGVTVLLTTHLMEDAERCDRIALLDRGRLVALDSPKALRAQIGGDVVTLSSSRPAQLAAVLQKTLRARCFVHERQVRLEHADGYALVPQLMQVAGSEIDGLSIAKPTLEDVFISRTGHRLRSSVDYD